MLDTDISIEIRDATAIDALKLSKVLRPADRAEIAALGHSDAYKAMCQGISRSTQAKAVYIQGEIAIIFGLSPVSALGGVALVWALASPLVEKHLRPMLVLGAVVLTAMLELFPVLRNVVDARNTRAIRWLRHMGAEFFEPVQVPPEGFTFIPFTIRK